MQPSFGLISTTLLAALQLGNKASTSAFSPNISVTQPFNTQLTNGRGWSPADWANGIPMRIAAAHDKLRAINDNVHPNTADQFENCTGTELKSLQLALKTFQTLGQPEILIDVMDKTADKTLLKQFANDNHLLHQGAAQGIPKLFKAALTAGANPNQRNLQGDTPLCLTQKQNAPEYIRLLVQCGADPDLPNGAKTTPLELATQNNAYDNIMALLMAGATFKLDKAFFQKNISALKQQQLPDQARMKNYLLNIKLLLQLNDVKTGGMEIENELLAKQKLIDAIQSELTPQELACFQKSLALDENLRHTISPIFTDSHMVESFQSRCESLKQAIEDMDAYDFLWLSNGCSGHAINTVIQKDSAGRISLTVINSGQGGDHHVINALGQIEPRHYQFSAPPVPEFEKEYKHFEEAIIKSLAQIYSARYELGILSTDDYYKTLDGITHYKTAIDETGRPPPTFGQIISRPVPAIDPQGADNCSSMGMLATLTFISPAHRLPEYLIGQYENALLSEIQADCPQFSKSHYKQIVKLAKEENNIEWRMQQAHLTLKKAAARPFLDAKAYELLSKSLSLFTKVREALIPKTIVEGDEAATKMSDEADNMISLIRHATKAGLTPGYFIALIQDTQAGYFAPFADKKSEDKLRY